MSILNSNRKFMFLWIENEESVKRIRTLNKMLDKIAEGYTKNDWEWEYALYDDFDKLLDLKKGEVIPFQFNRDNKLSQGIIKRLE